MKRQIASVKFSGIGAAVAVGAVMIGLLVTVAPCGVMAAPPKVDTDKPYNLELYTVQTGFPDYATPVAVADLINKNSKWLEAGALER